MTRPWTPEIRTIAQGDYPAGALADCQSWGSVIPCNEDIWGGAHLNAGEGRARPVGGGEGSRARSQDLIKTLGYKIRVGGIGSGNPRKLEAVAMHLIKEIIRGVV